MAALLILHALSWAHVIKLLLVDDCLQINWNISYLYVTMVDLQRQLDMLYSYSSLPLSFLLHLIHQCLFIPITFLSYLCEIDLLRQSIQ